MIKTALLSSLLYFSFLCATPVEQMHRKAQLAKIQEHDLKKLLLFSSLYPQTDEGINALRQAWKLLDKYSESPSHATEAISPHFADVALGCLSLIEPEYFSSPPLLSRSAIEYIRSLQVPLPNRTLKGYHASSLEELEDLEPEHIDVARAVLLLEQTPPEVGHSIEASLDILALSILSQIGTNATDKAKISAINKTLFHDMNIRYPPLSKAQEGVERYSDLSSVLSSKKGICLGTTVVYLCLAQRLGLPLTVYTPPGHIFLAHNDRVIETTARGIHIPLKSYLGLSLSRVPSKNLKQVIGSVAFNKAGALLRQERWERALEQYALVSRFDADETLEQITALCELLAGNPRMSQKRAQKQLLTLPEHLLEHDPLLIDLAHNRLSEKAARELLKSASFSKSEEQTSIPIFEELLKKCPYSLVISLHLSQLYAQYGKMPQAQVILEKLCQREQVPASVHFQLAFMYTAQMNYPKAWKQTGLAYDRFSQKGRIPEPLKELISFLQHHSPQQEAICPI